MKEATLTSAHVATRKSISIDFASILSNLYIVGKKVLNFLMGETFNLCLLAVLALGVWFSAVLASPALPWLAMATIVPMFRALLSKKGGEQ